MLQKSITKEGFEKQPGIDDIMSKQFVCGGYCAHTFFSAHAYKSENNRDCLNKLLAFF